MIYIDPHFFHREKNIVMSEITNIFTWTRQLECPPTVYNDSMKKMFVYYFIYLLWNCCYYYLAYFFISLRLCKGVLEFLWEDISNSTFPVAEACKIRKNILLYKLKHGLNDPAITAIKHLNQLKSKSNTLKQQISTLEDEYEEQDYVVRQKSKIKRNMH